MAIRIKNLDLDTKGMTRYETIYLGDVTACTTYPVWIAPFACVVKSVDIVSLQANPPATLTASTTNFSATITAFVAGSANTMGARGTSATAVNSNSISANQLYSIPITGNNSLSTGTPVRLEASPGGSGTLSKVTVLVAYRPLTHRETR